MTRTMLCSKCGASIPEEAKFCNVCGAPVPEETTRQPEPTSEKEANATPSEGKQANAIPEEPILLPADQDPGKKSKLPLVLGIVGLVAVLLGVFIALNFSFLKGLFIKTFGSDEDYFEFVEYTSLSSLTDGVTSVYGKTEETADQDMTAQLSHQIKVGEDVMEMLNSMTPEMKFDWLKELNFDMKMVSDGERQNVGVLINLGEDTALNLDVFLDAKTGKMLVGVPNLNEKYLEVSNEESREEESSKILSYLSSGEYTKALPSEEELNALVKKYVEIALGCVENVTRREETLTVDGVEQTLTVLEYQVKEENLANMSRAVLTEMKNDAELKGYLQTFEGELDKLVGEETELTRSFFDGVDEMLANLNEEIEFEEDAILVWTDYVDSKHRVVGRAFRIEGEKLFDYIILRQKNEIAVEANLVSQVKVSGKITLEKTLANGTVKLFLEEEEGFQIELKDLDVKALDEGKFIGSVMVTPREEIMEELLEMNLSGTPFEGLFIQMKSEKENPDVISFEILSKDGLLFGFDMKGEVKEGGTVEFPSEEKTLSADEQNKWLETMDLEPLIKLLQEKGIPVEMLFSAAA